MRTLCRNIRTKYEQYGRAPLKVANAPAAALFAAAGIVLVASSCATKVNSMNDIKQAEVHTSEESDLLFRDQFLNLDNWHLEGLVTGVRVTGDGSMRLDCSGSQQGGLGAMAFCKVDFPDHIVLEYDLYVESQNGLVITFLAMQGLNGEDAITGVPPRKGIFTDYIGKDASTRSYHVSLSRYNDEGVHTGVSNWRRNPGLHLVGQGADLCKYINQWYHIKIVKSGPACKLYVDDRLASEFLDPQTIDDAIPTTGKIGFRAIGRSAIFRISDLKVTRLP